MSETELAIRCWSN